MQRELTIKLVLIFVVGLAILIPTAMVKSKIYERKNQLEHAKHKVSQSWTGKQIIGTPLLIIPYKIKIELPENQQKQTKITHKKSILISERVDGKVTVTNTQVTKGIYNIPVYHSQIKLTGNFPAAKIQELIQQIKNTDNIASIGKPYISMYVADSRGIDKKPQLMLNQKVAALLPGSQLRKLTNGLYSPIDLDVLENTQSKDLDFSFTLSLRGMSEFSIIPMTDNSQVTIDANWPHPEFIGSSLPSQRTISTNGFSATWRATQYANDIPGLLKACIINNKCSALTAVASGVRFIEAVDIYLQSERAIKYAILFIGLSFISFFIFEQLKQIRIHPIQYTLVGLALAVFYLLLISLAEHISFYSSYMIAASSCCILLIFYVRYLLKSLSSAALFGGMISLLYILLYIIIRSEDFALLMGAILVFVVLAALMIITRHIDWYQLEPKDTIENSEPQ